MAELVFKYGTMTSGKTALLLQEAYNYEEQGLKVLIMKTEIDSRGCDSIVSKIGLKREVDHLISQDENVYFYIKEKGTDVKYIFIDGAHFLQKRQVDELLQVAIRLNIPVICYGLRTDFRGNGFNGAARLLEIAHEIKEIKTVCKCGDKATFSARKVNGKFTFSGESVAIDLKNKVSYEALCPKCYYDKMAKFKKLQDTIQ